MFPGAAPQEVLVVEIVELEKQHKKQDNDTKSAEHYKNLFLSAAVSMGIEPFDEVSGPPVQQTNSKKTKNSQS